MCSIIKCIWLHATLKWLQYVFLFPFVYHIRYLQFSTSLPANKRNSSKEKILWKFQSTLKQISDKVLFAGLRALPTKTKQVQNSNQHLFQFSWTGLCWSTFDSRPSVCGVPLPPASHNWVLTVVVDHAAPSNGPASHTPQLCIDLSKWSPGQQSRKPVLV